MRYTLLLALLGITSLALGGRNASDRPKITGIDHVAFYTTAPEGVAHLYHNVMGLSSASPVEPRETLRYRVSEQWVELMEFRPVEKPCCSDFQGPHPGSDR